MNLSICAIAKNENLYINDWCKYHLDGGFDRIFIFDNNSPNSEYVGNYIDTNMRSNITIIPVNYFSQFQKQAYNDFYAHIGTKFDWTAFIDIDEFIYTPTRNTIKSLLTSIPRNIEVVRLNWQIYGDDGILNGDVTVPVYERITKKVQHEYNYHAKCMVRRHLSNVIFNAVHYPSIHNVMPKQCTPSGKVLPDSAKINIGTIDYSQLYINHYMTKTWEEFKKQKLNRSDASLTRTLTEEYYFKINPTTRQLIANHDK